MDTKEREKLRREYDTKTMLAEIQHRLLKNCELSSTARIDNGIIHFTISNKIYLAFDEDKLVNIEDAYKYVLEKMSVNWNRVDVYAGNPNPILK